MEQENISASLLELIERPAFCVQNGTVTHANQSAQQRQILPGAAVADLFPEKDTAYQNYTGGELSLTVMVAGIPCKAQLSRANGYDIFVLDADSPELRAIALAAQHLRTPLSTVMTVTDQLANNIVDPAKQISHLQRGLHQLHRIVCNMSDSYRYQHSSSARMETTDIAGLFDECMEAIGVHLSTCGIRLEYTGLNQTVLGLADREMLERAVYNLISNAVKFMPECSTLETRLTQNGNTLCFTILNQSQALNNAFSCYLREPGPEDNRRGIGLGMELVRAVAANHGGTVLIDHPEGGSSRITMTLSVIRSTENMVRNTIQLPVSNYAGERSRGLLELSEVLPPDAYDNMN